MRRFLFISVYAALLLFLVLLLRIFLTERSDAREDVAARHRALTQYAKVSLQSRLHEQLTAATRRIDAAVADPLVDSQDTLYVVDGERVLPAPTGREVATVIDDDDEASEQPYVTALREAKDAAQVEKAVRGLLAHRARWKTPIAHDAEAVAQVVTLLLDRGNAAPSLLKGLLRDGFQGQEGLQRRLLRSRGQLSAEAFARWCERIVALSARAEVDASDFAARCQTTPPTGLPDDTLASEAGTLAGDWYLERSGRVVYGLRVTVPHELQSVAEQMTRLGLITPADTVQLEDVDSPRWAAAVTRADRAFALKAALLAFSALLGGAVLALASLAQRRKARFVEMREDFVSAVSHELKTPLASMRVMAETLQLRLEGNAAAKDYPARLVNEVDGLTALVENILSFNRLDKGRWQPQLGEVRLATLQPVLEEDARGWPAPVQVSFDGFANATLQADEELVRLCLLNLLRNACRYNARSPVTVAFSFDGATLRVADNGVGIAAEDRERVFEDFVRLKTPGLEKRSGSGLGLSLCRRVMAMHGGSITIESSSPAGTTFALRF